MELHAGLTELHNFVIFSYNNLINLIITKSYRSDISARKIHVIITNFHHKFINKNTKHHK